MINDSPDREDESSDDGGRVGGKTSLRLRLARAFNSNAPRSPRSPDCSTPKQLAHPETSPNKSKHYSWNFSPGTNSNESTKSVTNSPHCSPILRNSNVTVWYATDR